MQNSNVETWKSLNLHCDVRFWEVPNSKQPFVSYTTQICINGTIDVNDCLIVCFFSNAGYATWHCSGHPARWVPESGPDLTECVSIKLQNITDQVSSQTYQLEYLYTVNSA